MCFKLQSEKDWYVLVYLEYELYIQVAVLRIRAKNCELPCYMYDRLNTDSNSITFYFVLLFSQERRDNTYKTF